MRVEGRHFIHHSRQLRNTKIVYGGPNITPQQRKLLWKEKTPCPVPYKLYWGEIHGHTELSDGKGSLDDYFQAARDTAGLDFCAVTDHDHGGVSKSELWGEKWELTQQKVAEYHDPDRFVTLLGYERDSWSWYSNLCLYYRSGNGEMIRGLQDGEITRAELEALLDREDMVVIPHHTANLGTGVNFDAIPLELMTPLMEVYSKWGTSEYFGNPEPVTQEARGGHWQVALEMGARMGCVGGSDVHSPHPGLVHHAGGNLRYDHPGLVAIFASDLTREAIFDALKAKNCYATSGARIEIEFRINDAVMGQEISLPNGEDRRIWLTVKGEAPLSTVTIIKNGQDYFVNHTDGVSDSLHISVSDLRTERESDYYYIRVTQQNGRRAWSTPIWITV